ncbi:MAG: fasciclin domain-containing protein [Aeromicrobium sp.]
MKLTNTARHAAAVVAAVALSASLAACGGGNNDTETNQAMPEKTAASPTGPGAQTFGPACSAIPKSGAGSFNGMATAPVASAASANPLLTTLVAAVTKAGLVDTLNSADGITVFAPTDEAFAKIPKADLDAVLADKAKLTQILTHHVVEGQLDPSEVAGEHETLNKDMIEVKGDESGMTVDGAKVLCGNIPTDNATVYVIDTVLMP